MLTAFAAVDNAYFRCGFLQQGAESDRFLRARSADYDTYDPKSSKRTDVVQQDVMQVGNRWSRFQEANRENIGNNVNNTTQEDPEMTQLNEQNVLQPQVLAYKAVLDGC
ncbi:hypothetical protein RB195_006358 [Necator americanus]|uniref:Uncharacterized protein n=1 Tax=Necator americanus TaxID=51031 RepID=A0ABR1BS89_NECAM